MQKHANAPQQEDLYAQTSKVMNVGAKIVDALSNTWLWLAVCIACVVTLLLT